MKQIIPSYDIHIKAMDPILTPNEICTQFPMSQEDGERILSYRRSVRDILSGRDRRLLAIVGPCSIHDTAAALEKRLENLPRNEIASAAIQNNSKIILTKDMEEAISISDAIAPEHLELAVDNPFETLENVHNAGSIFLGHFTPEPLGDYFAGPNHTLPTNGSAKFSSPLSVDDFVKKSSYIFYSEQNLKQVEKDVAAFARREGLDAHAQAVEARSLKNE